MKWCRFQIEQHISYGVVENDRVTEVTGSPLAEYTVTETQHLLSEVKLLPPIIPSMLYAVGPNYRGQQSRQANNRIRCVCLDRGIIAG